MLPEYTKRATRRRRCNFYYGEERRVRGRFPLGNIFVAAADEIELSDTSLLL